MDKNKLGSSFNKQAEILNFLKSDLPEIFAEGKIDCRKLKQTLGEEVDDGNERYGLSWAGKSNCFKVIQEQTTATLKPAKDESVNFDQTQNLFIEGDNLEVLKVLQRSYYGKVKMIYIDPPYNTGNDFIYNDNFRKSKKDEMAENGEADENGDLTRVDGLALNRKDSNGHFHSDWLNMMYPRLFLARNLLKQDGVVFVSIDDNEVKNLRMIMDEIFGEENFIGQLIWKNKKGGGNDAKFLAIEHEYILMYAKSVDTLEKLFHAYSENYKKRYKEEDEQGKFFWDTFHRKTGKQYYSIVCPDGTILEKDEHGNTISWLRSEKRFKNDIKIGDARIVKVNDSWSVQFKQRMPEGKKPRSLIVDFGTTSDGSSEVFDLFKTNIFSNPKPSSLIRHLVDISTGKGDIILDFFAGSATTAHAVIDLDNDEEMEREWICVQLPEICEEVSEAYKAGYKTIAEIGKERIRRFGKEIKNGSIGNVDVGFKVLKLDKSNFKIWQGKFKNTENLLSDMADFVDNVNNGSKEENILIELILKSGLDLNVSIQKKAFGDDSYYLLDDGKLIVYLGKKITKEIAEAIQKSKPEKFICLDGCFQNNDQLKTNISLQMEQEKIDFKVI